MNTLAFTRGLLALGLLGAPAAAKAQGLTPPRHRLALRAGAAQLMVHDQNASPLAYRGHLAQLSLSYQNRTVRDEWLVRAQAAYGSFYAKAYPDRVVYFGPTPVPLRTNLATASVHLHYLHRGPTFAGGEVLFGGGLQQALYYPQSEPYVGLTSIASVPLVAKVRYALGPKTTLEAQGQYALAGFITRLPWHNSLSRPEETHQLQAFYRNNTRFAGGHRLQQASGDLTALRALGSHWQASVGYEFGLLRYPEPQPLTTLSHNANLGLHFTF